MPNIRPNDQANAEFIFSELIGNVVRHARNHGDVEVAIDHGGDQPIPHVFERGTGFVNARRLPLDPYAENGCGLFLIASLTADFTVSKRPGGSHARAELHGDSHQRGVPPKHAHIDTVRALS